MSLPIEWAWLDKEPGPRLLRAALADYGVEEWDGPSNNPIIIGWAKDLGITQYTSDEIPWCGLAMAHWAKEAQWFDQAPAQPLWARNWATFGTRAEDACLGDVLVFARNGGGHVGVYVAESEDGKWFYVIGGNQGDAVSIIRIAKSRLVAARRPIWRVATPPNRRRVFVRADLTPISMNEA